MQSEDPYVQIVAGTEWLTTVFTPLLTEMIRVTLSHHSTGA